MELVPVLALHVLTHTIPRYYTTAKISFTQRKLITMQSLLLSSLQQREARNNLTP